MMTASSLGKTPKTQRWVLATEDNSTWVSTHPDWTIHGPFQNLPKFMWGKSNNPSLVAKQWGVRPCSVHPEGGSEWREWNQSQKNSEKSSKHTGHGQDLVSVPRALEAQLHLFPSGKPPVCTTQIKLGFCHLPSTTLTTAITFPLPIGKRLHVYNTFNYRIIFVRILSVASGRNLAQTGLNKNKYINK